LRSVNSLTNWKYHNGSNSLFRNFTEKVPASLLPELLPYIYGTDM